MPVAASPFRTVVGPCEHAAAAISWTARSDALPTIRLTVVSVKCYVAVCYRFPRAVCIIQPVLPCEQVRLQLQSFGFTKGEATKVPTYRGTPLHVLATIIRNEGITGPFKVLRQLCSAGFRPAGCFTTYVTAATIIIASCNRPVLQTAS